MDDNWFQSFVRLHELYSMEFDAKKDEGASSAKGIIEYLKLVSPSARTVLDFPCGTGRISLELLKYGMVVTGIDLSTPFLDEFRIKATNYKQRTNLELVNASFKNFVSILRNRKYDLILNWWTSFGYSSYEDDVDFFKDLLNVAHKNTILIVETWHRDFIDKHRLSNTYKDLGQLIVLNENNFNKDLSVVETTHKYYKKLGDDLIFKDKFVSRIKLYSVSELLHLFEQSGWAVKESFNRIENRKAFSPVEDRIVIALKPRNTA